MQDVKNLEEAKSFNDVLLEPNGIEKIRSFLCSEQLRDVRGNQREAAFQMQSRLAELKGNFPSGSRGVYTKKQAKDFVWRLTIQWLSNTHPSFLKQFGENISTFSEQSIKSVRLVAMVLYYKYYLGKREPKLSDFGDLFQLYSIPYCAIAVVERDLANFLCQIKRNDSVLDVTEIYSSDFIRAT